MLALGIKWNKKLRHCWYLLKVSNAETRCQLRDAIGHDHRPLIASIDSSLRDDSRNEHPN